MATRAMEQPKVVSPAEWLAARKELLKKEHHDKYDEGYKVDAKAEYVQPAKASDAAGSCCEHH